MQRPLQQSEWKLQISRSGVQVPVGVVVGVSVGVPVGVCVGVVVGVTVGVSVGVAVGVVVGVAVGVSMGVFVGVKGTQTVSRHRAPTQSASVQQPPGGRQLPLQTSCPVGQQSSSP
jgi:hypothetical protein